MPTETVPEHAVAQNAPIVHVDFNQAPLSAVPGHVRHISKGGSGDYTRDPSLVAKADANRALIALRKMADPTLEGTVKLSKTAMIPLDFLKRCKGIQFVTTRLGGLVVSVELGHSFVIQRLDPDEKGNTQWSGPCFGTISNVGLGITAGYDSLSTIVILGNQTTVDKLKKGESKFGVDIDLIAGKESSLAQTDSNWTEAETAAIPYTLGGGALLNVSFKGGAHTINNKKNRAIYGPDASPEAILSGQISAPPEFQPLYDLLNSLSAAAVEEMEDPSASEEV
jgi:lipid-binding SYLF domain-containing protein